MTNEPEIDNLNVAEFRVVGGSAVTIKRKYDWICSIRGQGEAHACGGMLIDPSWVLTAKHCWSTMKAPVEVWVGGLDINNKAEFTVRTVAQRVEHPSLDCTLYKLDSPVTDRAVIALNSSTTGVPPPELITIGWGKLAEKGQLATTLQEVTLPIVGNDKCTALYKDKFVAGGMLCVGYTGGGKDACQGDSGGPLFTQTDPKDPTSQVLIGLTSLGIGCARPNTYSVWISVVFITPWIREQIPGMAAPNKTAFAPAKAIRNVFEKFTEDVVYMLPSRDSKIVAYLAILIAGLFAILIVSRVT